MEWSHIGQVLDTLAGLAMSQNNFLVFGATAVKRFVSGEAASGFALFLIQRTVYCLLMACPICLDSQGCLELVDKTSGGQYTMSHTYQKIRGLRCHVLPAWSIANTEAQFPQTSTHSTDTVVPAMTLRSTMSSQNFLIQPSTITCTCAVAASRRALLWRTCV